jgi:hypothetical protein
MKIDRGSRMMTVPGLYFLYTQTIYNKSTTVMPAPPN